MNIKCYHAFYDYFFVYPILVDLIACIVGFLLSLNIYVCYF